MKARSAEKSLCFLVGAGCSTQYPLALHVTRPILQLLLGRPPVGREKYVRFEFLMQVIKDYFDPQLTFLSEIYGSIRRDGRGRPVIHPYERLLALLAMHTSHRVFTTNFDRSIERAGEAMHEQQLKRGGARTFPTVVLERHFEKALRSRQRGSLFKLHGSIDSPKTLAATYDAIVPKTGTGGDPRQRLFARALKRGALCVIGYSGFDDMDVVPTLLSTVALDQEVHWFHHASLKQGRSIKYQAFRALADDVDSSIRKDQRPILPILEKLVASERRMPHRITVHCGQTEEMLSKFLLKKAPTDTIREAAASLADGTARSQRSRRLQAGRAINAWWGRQNRYAALLLRSAAIDVFYQHGTGDRLLVRLAADLDVATRLNRRSGTTEWSARLVALPRLAKVSYSAGDYEQVAQRVLEGRTLLESARSRQGACEASEVPPALVVSAVIELEQWGVEALRIQESLSDFAEVERLLAYEPKSVWQRLRECPAYRHMAKSRLVADPQFNALRAGAMTTSADIAFSRGRFRKSQRSFREAEYAWSRAGNGYWAAYCGIGAADSELQLGELAKARELYEHVRLGNVVSGWSQWIDFWPTLHLKDLQRLTQPAKWISEKNDRELEDLRTQREDSDVAAIATTLAWTKSWAGSPRAIESVVERYRQIARRRGWRPTDRISLKLLLIEFLLGAGQIDWAERLAEEARQQSERERAELFGLRARIFMLEIDRKRGKATSWKALLAHCERAHFSLGAVYVLAIALAGGQAITRHQVKWAKQWSLTNGLYWLRWRVDRAEMSGEGARVPLRFPHCYM